MWETWIWSLGREDPLEEGMATHSSILAWSMDRGAWRATAHGVAESRTRLRTKPSIQHRSPEFRQEGHRVSAETELARASAAPGGESGNNSWFDDRSPWSFPAGSEDKESAGDLGSILGQRRFPWRREWQPTPVILLGESRGQRSLAGYSACCHKSQKDWASKHAHPPPGCPLRGHLEPQLPLASNLTSATYYVSNRRQAT